MQIHRRARRCQIRHLPSAKKNMLSGLSLQKKTKQKKTTWHFVRLLMHFFSYISTCKLIRGRLPSNINYYYHFFSVIIVQSASQFLQCFHGMGRSIYKNRGEVILVMIFINLFWQFWSLNSAFWIIAILHK